MKYSLLKDILQLLEEYQSEHKPENVKDFVIWQNQKLFEGSQTTYPSGHDDLLIAFQTMHLNKSLKKQTKSVLSESKISSIDEYSFLLHLNQQDSFRKMEIIEMHNLEAPTGIEIIKRLSKQNLIEEFPDDQDKRAKRMKINRNGKKELTVIKPQIEEVFTKFSDSLSLKERILLSGLLRKLIQGT